MLRLRRSSSSPCLGSRSIASWFLASPLCSSRVLVVAFRFRKSPVVRSSSGLTLSMFCLATHARGLYCSLQYRPNHAVWRGPTASTTKASMTLIRNCRFFFFLGIRNCRLLAVHCPISWCGLHIRRRKATWIIRAMTSSPPSPRNLDMCVSTCKLDSTISLCTGWYDSSSTGFQPNVVNQVTKQRHVVRQ